MKHSLTSLPKDDDFLMPGEFEPHKGCWMIWPERGDTFRLGARLAQRAFAQVAETILAFEPVTMCVSFEQYENARYRLHEDIRLIEMSSDDAWARDTCPCFLVNRTGGIRGVDWRFNAWGGIFSPYNKDEAVAGKILELEKTPRYSAPLVLENGSIHADGQGTLLTTEECLLNPNRNPGLNKKDIEWYLKNYLNVEKIIWLKKGVYMDETNGHVDNLCAFSAPGEVVLTWTEDRSDEQYAISEEAFDILSNEKDAQGRSITVHKIPQPGPLTITAEEAEGFDVAADAKMRKKGDRLAASYVNFYIADNGIIMPLYNDPKDQTAVEILREIFPGRTVKGVPAREILLGGGSIHCITMQEPHL